jgi:drug/metabolite transporter (DMT)-like permease
MSSAEGANPIGNAVMGFMVGSLCLRPLAGVAPGQGDRRLTVVLLAYLGPVSSALAHALCFLCLTWGKATTVAVIARQNQIGRHQAT